MSMSNRRWGAYDPPGFRVYAVLIIAIAILILLAVRAFAGDPPLRPDPHLTPGATDPAVTQANIQTMICRAGGYTKSVRHTSEALKNEIYAEYRITVHPTGAYEIDHLIPLEDGGADVKENLWPQSYTSEPWNAHVKDKLENFLHRQVCAGKVTLADAQAALRDDWIASYQRYLGAPE
jgi:hypothetical protein